VAAIKIVVLEIDIFAFSTGYFNVISLDCTKMMKNYVIVEAPNTRSTNQLGWLEGLGRHKNPQYQAREDVFVISVGHGVTVLVQAYKNKVYILLKDLARESA